MTHTVDQALRHATQQLLRGGITDAANDARHLVAHALEVGRDRLILLGPQNMPPDATDRLAQGIARRIAREPVSRIIGKRLFWGREFVISPDVLDPRADTETLIATALDGPRPARLLDLGTGSGAIALTLLAQWPGALGVATDISPAALAVAAQNATALGVMDRLELTLSDWFGALMPGAPGHRFDLIVSNPPYISSTEMAQLAPEVQLHDPVLALTPGGDGLSPYRVIAMQAARYLSPQGRVIVEIGWAQGPATMEIFAKAGWQDLRLIPDLEGRDRVILAQTFADPAEKTRN